jgi:hypothetical protein
VTSAGCAAGRCRLITTLADPARYPAAEIVTLYHERWEIEISARDQVILAAGVVASTATDLAGTIGRHVLASPMPARRLRTSPRIVKRAISKYNARGSIDRATYRATINITILAPLTPGSEP